MTPQEIVIDTITAIVLRAGYCDFKTDGSFDPLTETILIEGADYFGDAFFDPPIGQAIWAWDGSGFVKGKDVPPVPTVVQLRSPDDSVWNVKIDDLGLITASK